MDEPQATTVTARKGFFPVVVGRDVDVRQAGGVAFIARHNLALSEGGGQWLVALGDQTIERGGGAALLSRHARVRQAFIGLLVSGTTTLEGSNRVLLQLKLPVAAAAAAGFAAGLLLGRLRSAVRRSPGPGPVS